MYHDRQCEWYGARHGKNGTAHVVHEQFHALVGCSGRLRNGVLIKIPPVAV